MEGKEKSVPLQSKYRGMEQLVARWAHNPKVIGSSPVPATKESNRNSVAFLLATNPLLNIATNQFSNCFNCSNEETRDKFLSTSTSISSEATIVTVISVSISSETLKLLRCKKFLPQ